MNKTSKYIIQAILIAIVVTGCIYSGRLNIPTIFFLV